MGALIHWWAENKLVHIFAEQCGDNYQNLKHVYLLIQHYPRVSQHKCLHMYTKIHRPVHFLARIYMQILDFIVTLFVVDKYREKHPAVGDGNNYVSFMLCDIVSAYSGCYDKIPQTG